MAQGKIKISQSHFGLNKPDLNQMLLQKHNKFEITTCKIPLSLCPFVLLGVVAVADFGVDCGVVGFGFDGDEK